MKRILSITFIYILIYLYLISGVVAVSSRWYAGYYFYGYGSEAPWGVRGRILTVEMNVPFLERASQWITVILDYKPLNWLQVGYLKRWVFFWTEINFYVEKNDSLGYLIDYYDGPSVGSVHTYVIVTSQKSDLHFWKVVIDPGVNPTLEIEWYIDPYIPIDFQVMIELHADSIEVPESHFYSLSYYDGRVWNLWNRHLPKCDNPPFVLEEVSHHEFYAWTE